MTSCLFLGIDYTEGDVEGTLLVQKWHAAHEFQLFFTKHPYYLQWEVLAKNYYFG